MTFYMYDTFAKVLKYILFTMLILAVSFALLTCLFGIPSKVGADVNDPQTDESVTSNIWFVSREMWLATEHNRTETIDEPLRLVIIHHTVSQECNSFVKCAAILRIIQSFFLKIYGHDIPYNFIIGNDGRVYEGRGWNKVGGHTVGYNRCSLGLAFIGDYRNNIHNASKVTPLQEARAQMLFSEGIRLGYLRPNFNVLGAMDLQHTLSPGENLQGTIKNWPNYDHENRFKNLNCDQIKEMNLKKSHGVMGSV